MIVNCAWKNMKFSMKLSKKYSSKYELEKWWKYFSSEMHQTTLPGHWKCFHWCLWRDHIDACEKNQVFSCLLITVGIPIVNACTTASLYRNAWFLWGRGAGVSSSNFMFFSRKITSDGANTIYLPRAFQRAAPHCLILQHVKTPGNLVSVGRNPALTSWSASQNSSRISR